MTGPQDDGAALRRAMLAQIRELRRGFDPELLKWARYAVEGKVPYDRENAQEAVRQFLQHKARDDGGRFRRKLAEALSRSDD